MKTVKQFKHDMVRGIGSCYIELDSSKNIDVYKEAVLFGLTNAISFEQQMEGTRSDYLYDLTLFFNDESYFVNGVIDRLKKKIYSDGLFIHLVEHLVVFAK